jgi:L-asparaginase II
MSEILINIKRGSLVESIHRGDAVAVKPDGTIFAKCGDPQKLTFMRSAAKPIQALALILSGAADEYGISDKELSVICSSHYAEPFHLEAVLSILSKISLDDTYLLCGKARPLKEEVAFEYAGQGISPQKILSDCSGKHSGMLATCKLKGYPLDSYIDPNHPLQQEILQIMSDICAYPKAEIQIGIDGCSVPVFGMPVYNMALGFARFANPTYLPEQYRTAAGRIFNAMITYPEMVAGTEGFCTELMQATNGRLIGKIGAQGVYCIGIKEPQLGIAFKIEDGMLGMASVAAMHVLTELDLLSEAEYAALAKFHIKPSLNDAGLIVGEIRPVFKMEMM